MTQDTSTTGLGENRRIKEAYAPIFDSNENAQSLDGDSLKGLVAQVSGADRDISGRIYSTMQALLNEASFEEEDSSEDIQNDETESDENETTAQSSTITSALKKTVKIKDRRSNGLNSDFHFNIQVHLPNNGTEETYLNIFNAIREAFQ